MLVKNLTSSQLNTVPRKTVLIVEDDDDIGEVLKEILLDEGDVHVIVASDAMQAFKAMNTVVPNLILLDYRLPDMNGLEFIDHMRCRGEFARIPVVMISATLPPALTLHRRRIVGMQKPFDIEDIINVVEQALMSQNKFYEQFLPGIPSF